MNIYVDATTCIALGTIGELELLTAFDGTLVVLPQIRSEVTTQPARATLERLHDRDKITIPTERTHENEMQARDILGESDTNGDVRVIAAVLTHGDNDERVAVVSDDQRVRTVARGLGATVTGTIGVVVRAVEDGLSADEANAIVRRVDEHGLHMTAELRAKATDLIEDAAT